MKECCRQYLNGQFGGDAGVIDEIYAGYASSVRSKAEGVAAALYARQWIALGRAAHAAKGAAL